MIDIIGIETGTETGIETGIETVIKIIIVSIGSTVNIESIGKANFWFKISPLDVNFLKLVFFLITLCYSSPFSLKDDS